MKNPENDVCETHSRDFFLFVNGGHCTKCHDPLVIGALSIIDVMLTPFGIANVSKIKNKLL